jgi:hypothetical protein
LRLPFRNLHNPEIQANFEAIEEITDIYLTDTGWIKPVLKNAWANAGGVREESSCAYRLIGKEVKLRGLLVTGANGAAMFQLPEGFRPLMRKELISAIAAGGAVYAHILIEADGKVVPFFGAGGEGISLDNVQFTVD